MDPKTNRRIKKNENYKKNLERRQYITKKLDYLDVVSDGIFKKEKYINPQNGKYEFVTTRNKEGNVVTREKFTYNWTAQAKAIQKLYHDTKNGIETKATKPKELFFNVERTKEEIKEYFAKKNAEKKKDYIYDPTIKSFILNEIDPNNRNYSAFHYSLIDNLYMNNKQIQIIKNVEATAKHEQKIKDLMYKLMIRKGEKPSFKLFKKTKKNNETNLSSLNIAA